MFIETSCTLTHKVESNSYLMLEIVECPRTFLRAMAEERLKNMCIERAIHLHIVEEYNRICMYLLELENSPIHRTIRQNKGIRFGLHD